MVFSRRVEVGRVALVESGADAGKLAVIVDVVDGSRALVDGQVGRQVLSLRKMTLTPLVCKVPRSAAHKHVVKAMKKDDIEGRWAASAWGKKLANRATRQSLNDFQRFQLMVAQRSRSHARKQFVARANRK